MSFAHFLSNSRYNAAEPFTPTDLSSDTVYQLQADYKNGISSLISLYNQTQLVRGYSNTAHLGY